MFVVVVTQLHLVDSGGGDGVGEMAPIHYGIWGKPTSTIDWCEENYVVTQFIAEFWNTISNWIMIIPPLIAAHLAWKKNLELRIVSSYLSVGLVGLGSFGFHCTLIYKMQLMDELPMIYGTCVLLYNMLEVNGKENKTNKELAIFFAMTSIFITIAYIVILDPLFFQWSYGLLAGWLFGLTLYNCKRYNGSVPLVLMSILSYGFGFILWNIDNNFCPQVRTARTILPDFVKPVTQLHAWWHTLAGTGTYFSVLYSSHLRFKCLGYQPVLKFYYRFLPFIEREGPCRFDKKEKNNISKNGSIASNNNANGFASKFQNSYSNGAVFKSNEEFIRTK